MAAEESKIFIGGNFQICLPVLIFMPYMWESREPKNIIPSDSDRDGDDHILSSVSNSHILEPSLTSKQYILLSDLAKKTLSFIVAGEAITGFEICLFHFIAPVD